MQTVSENLINDAMSDIRLLSLSKCECKSELNDWETANKEKYLAKCINIIISSSNHSSDNSKKYLLNFTKTHEKVKVFTCQVCCYSFLA